MVNDMGKEDMNGRLVGKCMGWRIEVVGECWEID